MSTAALRVNGLKFGTNDGTVSALAFGAIGDGATDNTTALTNAIAALAAGSTLFLPPGNYVASILTIATNNVKIIAYGAKLTELANAGSAVTFTGLLNITGNGVSIYGLEVDGNQSGYSVSKNMYGINITGTTPTLEDVYIHDTCSVGLQLGSAVTGGKFARVKSSGCANLGLQVAGSTYSTFTDCSFDKNGFGFQVAYLNPNQITAGLAAFGVAVRYVAHHINFINCSADYCGRDGFNVNQGSHDISFVKCRAKGTNDGGFTTANDNGGSGNPGEGLTPFNISYVDCEASNNWSSGLALYCATSNVQVIGGRYFNNHRLAGHVADTISETAGIFVAAGSRNFKPVGAHVYDDRQSMKVTATANPTFTGAAWTTGTTTNYPKVAVYTSAGVLRGYAKITGESATTVTLSVSGITQNPVTLANIVNTDVITQAVQLNGVSINGGGEGVIDVFGYSSYPTAWLLVNTPTTGGAPFAGAYKIANTQTDYQNWLTNPTFDAAVTNWTANTCGIALETVNARSAGSMKITMSGAGYVDATLVAGNALAFPGTWARFGGWLKTTDTTARLRVIYQVGGSFPNYESTFHPGDGNWHFLEVWAYIPLTATAVFARIYDDTNTAVVYADSMILQVQQLENNTNPVVPFYAE